MLTSMRFEPDEGKESGRLGVYLRLSFTCRVPLGYIEYENDEEKEELRKIMIMGHPDVEVIGPEVTIGIFHKLYYKDQGDSMELKLMIVHDEGKESGVVLVHKHVGNELKRMGEIKFSDAGDKKWILMVMTEDHPNVSIIS